MADPTPPVVPEPAGSRSLARNVAINSLGNVIAPVLGMVTTPVLAVGLGVFQRGEVAAATAPVLLALAIGPFGMPESLTYTIARSRVLRRRALLTATVISMLGALLLIGAIVLVSPTLARDDRSLHGLINLAAVLLVPMIVVAVLRAIAAGMHRWTLIAAESTVTAASRLILVCALAFTGHLTATSATLAYLAPMFLGGVVYLPLLRAIPFTPERDPAHGPSWFFSYGARIWIGYIGGILLLRLDQLVMTPLSSKQQLGLYVVAVSLAEIVLVITNAVRDVSFSADAAGASATRLIVSARVATAAAAAFALLLAIATPVIVYVLLTPAYRPCIPITWMLIVATVVLTPGSVAGAGLSARGRPGLRSGSLCVAAVINLVCLVVTVPHYGAMGAAVATVIGNAVFGTMNIALLSRLEPDVRWTDFYGVRAADRVLIASSLRAGSSAVTATVRRVVSRSGS